MQADIFIKLTYNFEKKSSCFFKFFEKENMKSQFSLLEGIPTSTLEEKIEPDLNQKLTQAELVEN